MLGCCVWIADFPEFLVLVAIGYLAAALTSMSALPQLIRTFRTRDVRGISIPSWLTLAIGVTLWFVYGIAIGSGPLIVANAVGLALDVGVLLLALRLRSTAAFAGEAHRQSLAVAASPHAEEDQAFIDAISS